MTERPIPLHPKDGEGDQPKAGGGVARARQLRREMSLPERLLWQHLRGRGGVKVRRQHPISPYVADFYIAAARMVIEIDSAAHDSRTEKDRERDLFLTACGLRVMHLPAADLLRDIDAVADSIFRAALPLHRFASGPPPHAAHGEECAGTL